MNQSRKDAIILKIRKSSLIVGILCIASMLINIVLTINSIYTSSLQLPDKNSHTTLLLNALNCGIRAGIMLIAAVLFFSMFRSGRPFTPKKIRVVLLIAVMLLLRAAVSSFMSIAALNIEIYKAAAMFVIQGGWMESVLFLFAALIMYYAAMLQQESDETL